MNRRKIFYLFTLLAAGGGPFLFFSDGLKALKGKWDEAVAGFSSSDAEQGVSAYSPLPNLAVDANSRSPFLASATGEPGSPLAVPSNQAGSPSMTMGYEEAFNFNATPEWVVARWPRVTTALGNLELSGMRVALVTGIQEDDLHGSLTYYFDKDRRLQRITFQGQTGEMRRVVSFFVQRHGFRAEKTIDAALFTKRWNGKPRSVLWVGHAPVVQGDASFSRLAVRLEVNRTDGAFRLSPELSNFLASRKQTGRW